MATDLIILAVALGAVLRITRLVVEDAITAPVREALDRRAEPRPTRRERPASAPRPRQPWAFLSALVGCSWCTSVWVAFGVLAPLWAWYGYDWRLYPLAALTASWLVGIAASWLDSPPPPRHVVHHFPDPVVAQLHQVAPVPAPGQRTAGR